MWSNKCVLWTGGSVAIAIAIILTLCLVLPSFNNNTYEAVENNTDVEDTKILQILVIENHGCTLTSWDVGDLNSTETILKHGSNSNVNCNFDLFPNHTIYYNEDVKSIKSTSEKYPNMIIPSNFYSSFFEKSYYILAVDFVNHKVYAISTSKSGEAHKLFVQDIWKQHYTILLTDLDEPTDLALDPTMGLLFISQRSSILRVSMDGANLTKILEQPRLALVLSIDRSAKRIYWSSLPNIESVDYAGRNRQVVSSVASLPLSLTAMSGRIIWLSINFTGRKMLWTCRINNRTGSCDSVKELKLNNDEDMRQIKGYDFGELSCIVNSTINPCAKDNGGCQQLCLLSNSASKGYSCACVLGQMLKEDQKSCVGPIDHVFLMYVQGVFVRGKILNHLGIKDNEELRFGEAIYPVSLRPLPLEKYGTINFAYDVHERLVFHIDKGVVMETNLIKYYQQPTLIDLVPKSQSLYLATDWVSQLIYVSTNVAEYWKSNEIRVYPYHHYANMKSYKILVQFENKYKLGSVVVHPNRGYVFFILTEFKDSDFESRIIRINSDGTDQRLFLENQRVQGLGLSIDFMEDRLYWFSEDGTKLESVTIDGSTEFLRSINISMISDPTSMSFDESFAYVSNLTHVWRLDKVTGSAAVRLKHVNPGEQELLSGVRYHSPAAQPILNSHPCVVDKGGCQTFCFVVPKNEDPNGLKKQCGCYEGKKLQLDKKSCS